MKNLFDEDSKIPQRYKFGLNTKVTYRQFKENLKNAGPPPISKPDPEAARKWMAERGMLKIKNAVGLID